MLNKKREQKLKNQLYFAFRIRRIFLLIPLLLLCLSFVIPTQVHAQTDDSYFLNMWLNTKSLADLKNVYPGHTNIIVATISDPDLSKIPANIARVAFTVTIYDAENRRQNFGQVSNAYIRIVDTVTNQEIIRYDLGEDFSIETAVVVGEIYRINGEWKFNAIGSGFQGGLAALCGHYGIEVA